MCFNAAKSWYSGWYSDDVGKEGHQDLTHFDTPGQWWKGKLVGIDVYLNDVFDENQHQVVMRISMGLYMMFNRKKGMNSGVKAYGDQVVVVQQWGKGGKSKVLATLDEENDAFTFSNEFYEFDIVVKVCDVFIAPIATGPQITGGTASQSSTSVNAEADRAIDGNLDQSWLGGSVTHTNGEEDPWWTLTFDQVEKLEHIRIYNRGDCCEHRLNNAIIELFNAEGDLLFSHNIGPATKVEDVYLGRVYNQVKQLKIRLNGRKILSLAEVDVFGPTNQPRVPDYARVLACVPNLFTDFKCESTEVPSESLSPSTTPTLSLSPSIYKAIPSNVVLLRDDTPCISQVSPSNHPDRFKCFIEPVTSNSKPGGHNNDPVALVGRDGCIIVVQPVTWAWAGNAFIFESVESLDSINACFGIGTEITASLDAMASEAFIAN